MGDGVNIAARLEGIAKPGAICLSEDAYRQVKGRLDLAVTDLGPTQLKNIAEPIRVYSLEVGAPAVAKPTGAENSVDASAARPGLRAHIGRGAFGISRREPNWLRARAAPQRRRKPRIFPSWCCPSQTSPAIPRQDYFADGVTENLTTDLSRIRDSFVIARNTAFTFKGKNHRRQGDRQGAWRSLRARRLGAARPEPRARQRAAHRRANPARISGPTASRKTSPTCSSCRIRSWRDWPMRWAMNLSRRKRKRAPAPRTPTPSISIMRGWRLVYSAVHRRRRTT